MATQTAPRTKASCATPEVRARRRFLAQSFDRAAQTAEQADATSRDLAEAMGERLLKLPAQ